MEKYLRLLELDQVLEAVKTKAIMAKTQELIGSIKPTSDQMIIEQMLTETKDATVILYRFSDLPIYFDSDISLLANKASKGGVLSSNEIYDVVRMNHTIKAIIKLQETIVSNKVKIDTFDSYVDRLMIDQVLHDVIIKSIDSFGEILDSASPLLKQARTKIKNLEKDIRSKMQEIISKQASMLSQAIITVRNDRLVVPVKQEYKNVFKGIIHDESSSGETVFMEPSSVFEKNNEMFKAREDVKKEEYRVLKDLSNQIGDSVGMLTDSYLTILDLDFIFAKAKYAIEIHANKPRINQEGIMDLIQARHPLLKVKKVVPNTVTFGKGYQGIIITGPNTGGKTVLLKTVGLIALMVKCGLLVPCDELSNVMIYDQVFSDIGDEQSIGQNLSTFSSHMTNIIHILNHITPHSLVLLDEVGSGTDPKEGSSLAIAILEYLLANRVMFIVTTHYSELKAYAYNSEKVINASVEFSVETLSPTYKLLLGVPGQSNAYRICASLGLKPEIIEQASSYQSISDTNIQTMISKLENQSYELELKLKAVEKEKQEYIKLNETFLQGVQTQEKEKSLLIQKAKSEAQELIIQATKKAKELIAELETMKDRETKFHEIANMKYQLKQLNATEEVTIDQENHEFVVGDFVEVIPYQQTGQIKKVLKNNQFSVQTGNVLLSVEAKNLRWIKDKMGEPTKITPQSVSKEPKMQKQVSIRLDLRGERFEDALILLERYLDDCMLANFKQVTIIHGHGTGVIRELVQTVLKNNKHVKSFRYGMGGEGGVGATIVEFH